MKETAYTHCMNTGHRVLGEIQRDDEDVVIRWACTECPAFGTDD